MATKVLKYFGVYSHVNSMLHFVLSEIAGKVAGAGLGNDCLFWNVLLEVCVLLEYLIGVWYLNLLVQLSELFSYLNTPRTQ